jgi:hypothetical protein
VQSAAYGGMSVFLNLDASASESETERDEPQSVGAQHRPRMAANPRTGDNMARHTAGDASSSSSTASQHQQQQQQKNLQPNSPPMAFQRLSGADRGRALVLDGPEDEMFATRQFALESPAGTAPGRVFQSREEETDEAELLRLRLDEAERKPATPSRAAQADLARGSNLATTASMKGSFRGNVSTVGGGPSWASDHPSKHRAGGKRTHDTATQTDSGEAFDYSQMPSAHILDDRKTSMMGDARQTLRKRMMSARRSKMSPEPRALDLDAPRRLQER